MKLKFLIFAIIFIWATLNSFVVCTQPTKSCMVEKSSISRLNTGRYNNRAMLLKLKFSPGFELKSVSLETLSQEVVVGVMGITVMKLN